MPDGTFDIEFSVPFTHRLRLTEDVAGNDFDTLLELLIGGHSRARVFVVAETPVVEASPRVREISRRLGESNAVELVAPVFQVPGGEVIKNSDRHVRALLEQINRYDLDRRSYVVAIGGGAMLDAVGYAAATAHRGIRLVRIPTTTLAQADSGVGVKNAINHFQKKNWIGTFAVPWAVINDAEFLETLPDREFVSGFSEAVKVSLLKDRGAFDWLCDHAGEIRRRDRGVSGRAIQHACLLHLRHITEGGDPFEMLEARPLDFGHWSAHRLEPLTDYEMLHGEAVAIGVALDCIYSSLKFGFPEADLTKVLRAFHDLGLPLWDEALQPSERLLVGLEEFRQHLGGRLTITMLRSVGDPLNVHEIDEQAMRAALKRLERLAENRPLGQDAASSPNPLELNARSSA